MVDPKFVTDARVQLGARLAALRMAAGFTDRIEQMRGRHARGLALASACETTTLSGVDILSRQALQLDDADVMRQRMALAASTPARPGGGWWQAKAHG